jgi:hypothetical protein
MPELGERVVLVDPLARLLNPAFICRVAAVNLLRRQRDNRPRQGPRGWPGRYPDIVT